MKPIRLAANRFPGCCRGGPATDGLTRLEDGRTLREAIQTDPVGSLGQRHADACGADRVLLVKLLHAGERLPGEAEPYFRAAGPGEVRGRLEAVRALPPSPESVSTPPGAS